MEAINNFIVPNVRIWKKRFFLYLSLALSLFSLSFFFSSSFFWCSSLFFSSILQISISSVQSLSPVRLFATPWTAAHQASLPITSSWSLLKLTSIESVMPSNHLILCRSLHSCLRSFLASGSFSMSQFFTSCGQSICSFSFSMSPSNEHSGLISFRMD